MSLRGDLIAAKALIDAPEKWGKGTPSFGKLPPAPLCAAGACDVIAGRNWSRRYRAMHQALVAQVPRTVIEDGDGPGSVLPKYNDAPRTTHADIMALFDRAIAAAGDA